MMDELKQWEYDKGYDRGYVDAMTVLDKIRAEIEEYKSTIYNAISEDELKIKGMKEAYTNCIEIIDKYKMESEDKG